MQERDPEYDRFGPWVLEISDEDPPPPLFLPHLEMDRAALLRIKIPRRVERRNARPGMNLYDYVISLFDDEVEVLQRVEDSVKSTSFRYTDVKRVVHREDLLRGDIDVVLKDTTVELPFSTISSDLMGQLVAIIRRRYVDESRLVDVNAITPPQAESQSFYFRGLLRGLRSESPHVRLIGFQDEVPLGRYHEGFFRTMFFRVVGKRLLETLYLTDGRELQFLDQGRTYRYRGRAVYARNTHYVPVRNINGGSFTPVPGESAVVNLSLDVAGGPLTFTLLRGNPAVRSISGVLAVVPGFDDSGPGNDAPM